VDLWQAIAGHITAATGQPFAPAAPGPLGGGCISTAVRLTDNRRSFFVKVNGVHLKEMFAAEAEGLTTLAATGTLRVPGPVCHGTSGDRAYLVMEYVTPGRPRRNAARAAGQGLASLHRSTAPRFGWHRDNTIGSTHQPNAWDADWVQFWRHQRLGFQLRLAARTGYYGRLQRRGERLLAELPALLVHAPAPSLLHGDLWGGNLAYDQDGRPWIFDPAVYFGDREADLAMTELFGGFPADFYAAYQEAWPLDPGYPVRRTLYNLYHILNHANLFGGGYWAQAQGMMDRLLAELGG
jgi:protein-ribulosamine 3-kinase